MKSVIKKGLLLFVVGIVANLIALFVSLPTLVIRFAVSDQRLEFIVMGIAQLILLLFCWSLYSARDGYKNGGTSDRRYALSCGIMILLHGLLACLFRYAMIVSCVTYSVMYVITDQAPPGEGLVWCILITLLLDVLLSFLTVLGRRLGRKKRDREREDLLRGSQTTS